LASWNRNGDAFGGEGEGGFGLFDGEEEEEEEEDLDEDVAEAEAESFFEDDFEEDEEFEEDAGDDLGFDSPDEAMDDDPAEVDALEDDAIEDDAIEEESDDAEVDDDGGQAGGSTFEELKEEYESGDADWAEGEAAGSEQAAEMEAAVVEGEESIVGEDAPTADPEEGEFEFEEPADADPVDATGGQSAAETRPANDSGSGLDSKPYLAELPKGYVADLVVMEWLEFLVVEFGPEDAVRTIEYYEDIGWISESVEEELLSFVSGFADVESVEPGETGPATLEIDDHIQSLTFLSQLTGDAVQRKIVEHCARIRGGNDGIQR